MYGILGSSPGREGVDDEAQNSIFGAGQKKIKKRLPT